MGSAALTGTGHGSPTAQLSSSWPREAPGPSRSDHAACRPLVRSQPAGRGTGRKAKAFGCTRDRSCCANPRMPCMKENDPRQHKPCLPCPVLGLGAPPHPSQTPNPPRGSTRDFSTPKLTYLPRFPEKRSVMAARPPWGSPAPEPPPPEPSPWGPLSPGWPWIPRGQPRGGAAVGCDQPWAPW